jgi:DNA-binding HxlR family transcriptional regulator
VVSVNSCASREMLDLISDKWSAWAIHVLHGRAHRFKELERALEGISQKVLTQTLRRLERDGLVTRTVFPEVPPRVEYALSSLGQELHQALHVVCEWAERRWPELVRARDTFDGTTAASGQNS